MSTRTGTNHYMLIATEVILYYPTIFFCFCPGFKKCAALPRLIFFSFFVRSGLLGGGALHSQHQGHESLAHNQVPRAFIQGWSTNLFIILVKQKSEKAKIANKR
jgi:hypothetical protein